jgi:predicted small metal-binding protein
MFSFVCRDMGMDCPFTASAESMDEVVQMAMDHGSSTHAEEMKTMMAGMSEDQMKDAVRAKVKQM